MGVEFNESNDFRRMNFRRPESDSKVATWLISKGIAKDEGMANKIQIGIAILFFALALFFILR